MRKEGEILNNDYFPELKGMYQATERVYKIWEGYNDKIKPLEEASDAIARKYAAPEETSASPLTGSSSAVGSEANIGQEVKRGGIDLTDRAMHIKLERVGSFADLKLMLPGIRDVESVDPDNEFKQIQAMADSDIRPSDVRILEFEAACYYQGEFDQRLTQITDCIKNAHLVDERLGQESSDTLRLATMLPEALYGRRI